MNTVHIPHLNREVSRLGLGTMVFSGAGEDKKEFVFSMMDAFLEAGGNFIDTAEVYRSEPAIAMWLEETGRRDDLIILDKALDAVSKVKPEAIHTSISGNLERLRTDTIDLWMLHRDNLQVPVGELVDALNEEVNAGRIRSFGGSNWTPARLAEANAYAERRGLMGMAASSPNLSLAMAKEPFWADCVSVTPEDRKWYEATQMPLVSWSSQARGFFSGRYRPEDTSDANMVRVFYSDENFEKLRRAETLGERKGVSAIQIALSYALHQPFPVVALIGPLNVGELQSCLQAEALALTPAEMDWLDLKTDSL